VRSRAARSQKRARAALTKRGEERGFAVVRGNSQSEACTLARGTAAVERLERVLGKLSTRRARVIAVVLALLLVAPSIATGFAFDDYILLDELAQRGDHTWPGSAPFDLFRWLDPAHVHRMADGQGLAFWTFERTTNAYLRPVTSLSHTLDGLLWPRSAPAMHLHSVLWFGLLLALVGLLYAELIEDRWIVGVASAMFALDSAHGVAVGWIANRNAMVGGAFGAAALLFHRRWRRGRGARYGVLAFACAAGSVFSAELAVGVFGYLFAYALCYERDLRARVQSLAPYALLLACFVAARRLGHYGVYGLGAYVDPMREPLAFLAKLPVRVLVLLSSQVARLNADAYELASASLRPIYFGAGLVACGGFVFCAWPSVRARRELRFFAAGALLSALPLAAGAPSDRLLTFVGCGVMPVIAAALRDVLAVASERLAPLDRVRRGGVIALAFVHLAIDPLLLPVFALSPAANERAIEALDDSLPGDATLRARTVIVTEVPDSVLLTYLPAMRTFKGESPIGKLYWLVGNATPVRFERRSSQVLRVTTRAGFFSDAWEERAARLPFHAGERVELSEMSVTIVDVTRDGRPLVCDFTFNRPLEASQYVWLRYDGQRLRPTRPPPEVGGAGVATANLGG
jgi:hypothetical protein